MTSSTTPGWSNRQVAEGLQERGRDAWPRASAVSKWSIAASLAYSSAALIPASASGGCGLGVLPGVAPATVAVWEPAGWERLTAAR